MNRREFVKTLVGAAAFAGTRARRGYAANERIVIGAMGLGGRGTYLAQAFAVRADCELRWLCDADGRRLTRAVSAVGQVQKAAARTTQDFREILADKDVDVLINATPDHWHALGTIMACQAGKDVYVEKPMAHNVWEGRKMVEAAAKYERVVQVGMQTRSAPYAQAVKDYIADGKIGKVHMVRVYNMMQHPRMRPPAPGPEPDGLAYDMWCGPAAKPPYDPNRYWLAMREYSCGPIPGDAVHQLDLARFIMGDLAWPRAVSATGGIVSLKDGRDTPDTQAAIYEYENMTLLFQGSLWTPYMKKIPVAIRDSDAFPDWPFCATRIEVLGEDGYIYVGRHGGGWVAYDADGKLVADGYGRQADKEHQDNFIECVRTRKQPNANAEQGHYSVGLCHMANASFYADNQRLQFDAGTETFPNCPQANKDLRRTYRAPWVVPDEI